jgi:Spy/CpxP family protein refolding chaperone
MKALRLLVVTGLALVASAGVVQAQGGGGGGGGGGNRAMERLMAGITLTDKQKSSVDSIAQSFRAQMPPMQQGTPPDSATRAKMGEVRQKQYAAIRTVLTADQQKVYDKNLEEMRANMNRPRP